MVEYTYKDVIIDPNDPRVEIGKEYYAADYPGRAITRANADGEFGVLKSIGNNTSETPFIIANKINDLPWACLIRKKEAKKKYVPFDLNDPEVRKSLRRRWIKSTNGEYQISGFHSFEGEDGEEWSVAITSGYVSPEILYTLWTFDDGTPCGQLVEEE